MYLYKVITAAIALKVDQPVLILEREGLPTDIYARLATSSKNGSTHRIASSRETGIEGRRRRLEIPQCGSQQSSGCMNGCGFSADCFKCASKACARGSNSSLDKVGCFGDELTSSISLSECGRLILEMLTGVWTTTSYCFGQ